MFRFISSVDNATLCQNYLAEFNLTNKETEFKAFLKKHPEVRKLLPTKTRTVSQIMVAPFKTLNKIYFKYLTYRGAIPENERKKIEKEITNIFNYDANDSIIAEFLMNKDNGFEINNCVYCDLEEVKGYYNKQRGKRIRGFQTEHVLDKGKCPLLGLSLFNFAPSCSMCNTKHKMTKTLGKDEKETLILSPTSVDNRFEEEVQFTLSFLNPEINDLQLFKDENDVEIDFKGNTIKYDRTITLFQLKDRYNAQIVSLITDFIKWRKYPAAKLFDMARASGDSLFDLFEALFGFKGMKNTHAPMEKCRRDLFAELIGCTPEDYLSVLIANQNH